MQMMYQEATFKLAHVGEVRAQLLELPYAGEELSLLVLLPDEGVELSTVRPGREEPRDAFAGRTRAPLAPLVFTFRVGHVAHAHCAGTWPWVQTFVQG